MLSAANLAEIEPNFNEYKVLILMLLPPPPLSFCKVAVAALSSRKVCVWRVFACRSDATHVPV